MKTKLVPLLVLCSVLVFSQISLAQYTGGSYDGYAMGESESDISLPVELSSFTATISNDSVILKWRSETEVGNVGFAIYRSERKDGKFVKVNSKLIKGQGNSTTAHDYLFIDETAEIGKTYYYYIEDVDISGEKNRSEIIKAVISAQNVIFTPKETRLLQNYPNPFNPETWIPFQLAKKTEVSIRIYNAAGSLLRTISVGDMPAGVYASKDKAVYWDGCNSMGEKVSSGLYFYQLEAGDYKATKRMLILK